MNQAAKHIVGKLTHGNRINAARSNGHASMSLFLAFSAGAYSEFYLLWRGGLCPSSGSRPVSLGTTRRYPADSMATL